MRDPVVVESGKNNTPEEANVVKLPAAVCGAVEAAEDVDYFKFTVDAGKTLVFQRALGAPGRQDSRLAGARRPDHCAEDSAGVVLAANDNFFFGDPLLSYTFKTAGDYYLEMRDVRYQATSTGSTAWRSTNVHSRRQ